MNQNTPAELDGLDFMQTMDIYAAAGAKIIYTGKNGYDMELVEANKRLRVGETYTVISTKISGFSTLVYIEEYQGYGFNSVHFVDAPK